MVKGPLTLPDDVAVSQMGGTWILMTWQGLEMMWQGQIPFLV